MLIYRLQEHEKVFTVLGKLGKVTIYHEKRALEHGIEYLGHFFGNGMLQLVHYDGHCGQDLGLACLRYILLVV